MYFYPRSPCGERPRKTSMAGRITSFLSTLSLRRATLVVTVKRLNFIFLSTLSLRRATSGRRPHKSVINIFLSTLSLRRATQFFTPDMGGNSHFYPRSPCGERPQAIYPSSTPPKFLSTLSLRRATSTLHNIFELLAISIHALLAESDYMCPIISTIILIISIHALLAESDTVESCSVCSSRIISIHALLAESDINTYHRIFGEGISIHALLAESDE